MKKMTKLLALGIFVILFSAEVLAVDVLLQTYESETLNILAVYPIENNNFYQSYYNMPNTETGYMLKLVKDNEVLLVEPDSALFTLIGYTQISDFDTLQVLKNDTVISEHALSFCNNNGICEPCDSPGCDTQENELTCADCAKSSKDNFCNIEDDGICDPDCITYDYEEEEEYESCFEEQLFSVSCEETGGFLCSEGETCSGDLRAIEYTGELCCYGSCELSNDIDIFEKSCNDFFYETCERNEICEGDEMYLQHNNQTCCTGTCEPAVVDSIVIPGEEEERDYTVAILLIIAILMLSGAFLVKKIPFRVSFIIAAVVLAAALLSIGNLNNITGRVVSVEEQKVIVCEIAQQYDIPCSYMLALAEEESEINHFDGYGNVKISSDGGIGIMQRDVGTKEEIPAGPYYVCGNSDIDGRRLDAKKLEDNIECGAKVLWEKCGYFDCQNSDKEYYCSNAEVPGLGPKQVTYSGWEIAIRGYNGWGCQSYYYMEVYGASSDTYEDIARRIQNYVEKFRETELKYRQWNEKDGLKPDDPPPADDDDQSDTGDGIEIPEEILDGEQSGYYYIKPNFKLKTVVDFVKITEELSYSNELVEYVQDCYSGSYSSCAEQKLSSDSKTNWNLDYSDGNIGYFSLDTGYEYYDYGEMQEKNLVIRFALDYTSSVKIKELEYGEQVISDEVGQEDGSDDEEDQDQQGDDDEKPIPKSTDELADVLIKDPWEPVEPPIQNSISDRSIEKYNEVIDQFGVEFNPRYERDQQGYDETYCNIFMWDVTKAMDAEIPHWVEGQELTANRAILWLEANGETNGWYEVNAEEAQENANEGKPTIATWYNSGGIGHVAIVRPGELTVNGPATAQAGATNFNYGNVLQGFSTLDVVYYAHS